MTLKKMGREDLKICFGFFEEKPKAKRTEINLIPQLDDAMRQ